MVKDSITLTKNDYDETAKHLKEYKLHFCSKPDNPTSNSLFYSNRIEQRTRSKFTLTEASCSSGWRYREFDEIDFSRSDGYSETDALEEANLRLKTRALERAVQEVENRTPVIKDLTQ